MHYEHHQALVARPLLIKPHQLIHQWGYLYKLYLYGAALSADSTIDEVLM
jgi:hypothetical protein